MHIGFPTQCMTDAQVDSGDEQMPNVKSDSDFFFLPASSVYWIPYLFVRIQAG